MIAPKLYLYVRHDMPVPSVPALEDDDVVDFEDIGGVYNDTGAASANTTALNNFFASVQSTGYFLRFGGAKNPTYQNKRLPGVAYFNGAITGPTVGGASSITPSVIVDGAGSKLQWTGGTLGNNPCITLDCNGSARVIRLHDLLIDSDGFGLYINNFQENAVLSQLRIKAAAAGTFVFDTWTDLATAGYGLALDGECDGGHLVNVSCKDCGGHGILVKNRWHDGRGDKIRVHNCAGSGFKGQQIQGCQLDGRLETNKGWGLHLRRSGVGTWDGTALVGVDRNTASSFDFWMENNNTRSSTVLTGSTGHAVRQARIDDDCGTILLAGHTGWLSNKLHISEGSRNTCVIVDAMHINQSVTPEYNLTDDTDFTLPHLSGSASNNNFGTKWTTSPGLKPTVTVTGSAGVDQGFRIQFPSGCLDNSDGTNSAYWRPWGLLSPFTAALGDVYVWEIELSSNGAGLAAWCIGREETSAQRQHSTICIVQVAAISGGKAQIGLYNQQRRKFSGTVHLTTIPSVLPTPEIVVWHNGSQNQSNFPQTGTLDLNIHSWKFYRIPK